MGIKKPSDYFKEESKDNENLVGKPNLNSYSEAFNSFKEHLSKFDKITDTIKIVDEIKTELQDFLKKEDLDNAMMSYVFLLEENINTLKDNVKSINTKTLTEIKSKVTDVTEVVNEFAEVELPKYKKNIIDAEVRSDKKFNQFKEEFSKLIDEVSTNIDTKQFEIESKTEENLNEVVTNFENKINDLYSGNDGLSKTIKTKVNEIKKLKKDVIEHFKVNKSINKDLTEKISNLEIEIIRGENNIKEQNDDLSNKISNLENEIIRGENNLKEHNDNLSSIEKNIKQELEKDNFVLSTKIKNLEEVYEKLKEESKKLKEDSEKLKEESKINETLIEQIIPSSKTSDPLTPLDQNYVTLDQLQEHYRLFLNRIQTQLSTLGGGGETRLQYLDDIVGIATNLSEYNGKFLKVDTSQPAGKNFIFETVSGGGGGSTGAGGTWATFDSNTGITTTKKVKIANDLEVTGVTTIGNVVVGGATTDLVVNGDARVTGILTIGTGSITLNPTEKKISGIDEIEIGSGTTAITIKKSETGEIKFTDENGDEKSVGIGTTVSINTSGIITATTFSGNITGTAATFSGNVSIAGTLTYEDVTNIDSVGLITAREGIRIGAGKSVGSDGSAAVYYGDGSNLTGVGFESDADGNLIAGTQAGIAITPASTSACYNIFLGSCTGKAMCAGDHNVFIGVGVGKSIQNESYNVYIGDCTATDSLSGDHNFISGRNAGRCIANNNNILIGCCAGSFNRLNGQDNVIFGQKAGYCLAGGGHNFIVGKNAACAIDGGSNNVILGQNAGCSIIGGSDNFIVGHNSGQNIDGGSANILLGYHTGQCIDGGSRNIILGNEAGKLIVDGSNNTILGKEAGRSLNNGSSNILIGDAAGKCLVDDDDNVFIGDQAGQRHCSGGVNVAIGFAAYKGGVGTFSTGERNIILGDDAGKCVTSGSGNFLVGYRAGHLLTSGSCNIMIGCCVNAPSATDNCQLVIGHGSNYWINGNSSFNVTLSGIATVYAASGIVSATKFCGDGSGLTNLPAGTSDKIEEGDSKVEVTDSGTGQINVVIDGNHFARFTNVSGRKAIFGSNVAVQNNYGTNCGDIIIADGGRRLRFHRTGVGLADDSVIGTIDFAAQQSGTGGQTVSLIQSSLRGSVENKSDLIFSTSNGGSPTEKLRIMHTGNVGIGTTNPDAAVGAGNTAKLSVGILSAYQLYGDGSTLTGISAGFSQDDQGNLVAGTNAGAAKDADTCFNIMIGCNAGLALCGGYGHSIFMGCHAGKSVTTGGYNFLFGQRTGCNITTGQQNIMMGNSNGTTMTTGCHNIFFGNSIASGGTGEHCNNIIMGQESAYNLDTGNDNIVIGKQAGCDISSGNRNIYIGKSSGANSTTGSDNIALGCCAMYSCAVTGSHNVFLGSYSGRKTESAACNIAIGYQASEFMETGTSNVAIGVEAGGATGSGVSGNCNVAIGMKALQQLTGGHCNVALGMLAGGGGAPGSRSIAIGTCAGWCGIKSDDTISIGYFAGCMAADPVNGCGIFIGRYAGRAAAEGKAIMIGCEAGRCAVDADNSIFIGSAAGKCACNASDGNLFIGQCAGRGSSTLANNTGDYNIAFGQNAMLEFTSASDNVVIGRNAGCTITSGSCNVLIGYGATVSSATGNHQLSIGAGNTSWVTGNSDFDVTLAGIATISSATGIVSATKFCGDGSALTGISAGGFTPDDQENLKAGTDAGAAIDADTCYNVLIGTKAGEDLNSGDDNVFIGCHAGLNVTSGSQNVFIGKCAVGNRAFTGEHNVAIGRNAGYLMLSGGCNIAIGNCVANNNTMTGSNNIYMGCLTACFGSAGNANVFIGLSAGKCGGGSSCNVFIGCGAGHGGATSSGKCNVYLGVQAGNGNQGNGSGKDNVAAGTCSLYKISGGYNNVAFGYITGCKLTDGHHNTFLGSYSGRCVTTGDFNVTLGYGSGQYIKDDDSVNLAIGCANSHWIVGNSDFNVGIGTTNPNAAVTSGNTQKLSVGILSAYQLYGDGSNLTGISAGGFSADADLNLFASNTCSGCNLDGSSGCFNVLIGACAGKSVTSGKDNVLLGKLTGTNLTSGSDNIVLGCCAMNDGTVTGGCNIAIGIRALKKLVSGGQNIAIGEGAGCSTNYANNNIFIGQKAGNNNVGGARNIAIGLDVELNEANDQLAIGCCTGRWIEGDSSFNTTLAGIATVYSATGIVSATKFCGDGSALTGISAGGFSADADLNLFASNTCSGCNLDGTNACFNLLLGACAGKSVDTGAHNVFLGAYAGMTAGDSQYNVYIGHNAGKYANEAGCCNVFIGADAGCKKCGTSFNCSVAIGGGAMKNHCNSYHNIAIGWEAMAGTNSTGVGNVAVGLMAGRSITSAQSNVLIGEKAGDSLTSGGGNVFLGKEAGHCGTSDLKFNVFIGCSAGYRQTAGCRNVLIGCRITAPIPDGSEQMGIGNETSYNTGVSKYWIVGNSNYNVGIGTTNPEPAVGVGNTAKLSVGILSAYQLYGDGSALTGIPSATRTTNRYIATANQTTFSATYTAGYVDVYLNGIKLDGQDEFTATNGTSVVLTDGATVGDIVEIVAQQVSATLTIDGLSNIVEDTTPQLGGNLDANGKDITGVGDINLSGIATMTNGFTSGTGGAVKISVSGSNLVFTVDGVGSATLTLS